LTGLEEESGALRELVAGRVEDLRQRVRGLRERVDSQSQAVDSHTQDIAAKGDAAATAYSDAASSLQQSLSSLRGRVDQSNAHIEQQSQLAMERATAATELLSAHLASVEAGMNSCIQVIDGQLRSHADRHAENAEDCESTLESEANQAVHRIVGDAVQSHQQLASEILGRKKFALETLASQLKDALTGMSADFGTLQVAQLHDLSGALEETDRSLKDAMSALTSTIGDFTKSASEVTGALETTQSGLRVVVGSLERTQRILEAIETL
jgi:hypothetical protein